MADYSSGTIAIYGTIQTIAQLKDLVDAIVSEGPIGSVTEERIMDESEAYAEILATLDADPKSYDMLAFNDDQIAGGELDLIASGARECLLPHVMTWQASIGYGAGCMNWHPDHGEARCPADDDGNPTIPLSEYREARNSQTPFADTANLLWRYERFEGKGFPPFRVSDEVRAFIEKEMAE